MYARSIAPPVMVLHEVYGTVKASLGEEPALRDVAARDRTSIVPFDPEIALEAADFSLAHRSHLSVALIYATARRLGAYLYTSNKALKGLQRVTVL